MPKNSEYYIYRSGRTGRGNYQGNSYVLFDTKNQYLVDELRYKGIKFETWKWDSEGFSKPRSVLKLKTICLTKTENEINKIKAVYLKDKKNKIVKPGYKKKMQSEINDVKRKIKREHIKSTIRKIKPEKSKQRKGKLFE